MATATDTMTEEKKMDTVPELPVVAEKATTVEAGEKPEQFAQAVIMNAENVKADVETSFAVYNQNPQFQGAEFEPLHTMAKDNLNAAWTDFQHGVEDTVKNNEQTINVVEVKPASQTNQEQTTYGANEEMVIKNPPQEVAPEAKAAPEPVVEVTPAPTPEPTPIKVEARRTRRKPQYTVVEQDENPVIAEAVPETPEEKLEAEKPATKKRGRPRKVNEVPVEVVEEKPQEEIKEETPFVVEDTPQNDRVDEKLTEEVARRAEEKENKKLQEEARKQEMVDNLNNVVDDTRRMPENDYVDDKLTQAVRERLVSVRDRAEEYRRKKAERESLTKAETIAMSPEKREFKESLAPTTSIYDRMRSMPVLKSFKGLIDRLEATRAAKKAEKLTVKISKVEAKLGQDLSPEKAQKLKEKQERLYSEKIAYEDRRNTAIDNTLVRMNEKIAPRKERAEQIENKLKNLKEKVEKYAAYRNQKALEYNELINKKTADGKADTRYINLRKRTLKSINKEIAKFDGFMDRYTKAYDKLKARKVKLDGVVTRWQTDADSFSKLKETVS